MKADIYCFSTHKFELENLKSFADKFKLNMKFIHERLSLDTLSLIEQAKGIMTFASDDLSADILKALSKKGIKHISMRSAGFSHLDLKVAKDLKLLLTRVPAYGPEAIAEHALSLLMSLNRKIIKANRRIKELDFRLEGLEGITLYQKTVGVIGAGHIGLAFCRIMNGLGCKVLVYDPYLSDEDAKKNNIQKAPLDELLSSSHIISLHCPLNDETRYIINEESLALMRDDAILINTGRGGLIDTKALIQAIKCKKIGAVGLDVYEFEEGIFFKDYSEIGLDDDTLARLITFPNVLITAHQAFFTKEALYNIAKTSMENSYHFISNQIDQIPKDNII